jgi:hypothetical protein
MAHANRSGFVRFALIVVGLALGGYGAVLVWDNPPVIIMRILVWALIGLLLHDLVFAPVCVALGFVGRRLIPGKWWPPIAVAAFCSVVLVFLAIPVYGKPGMRPDNVTVLDRNYPMGLWISLAIVWACVPVYYLARAVHRPYAPSVEIDTRVVESRRGSHSNSPEGNLGASTSRQLPIGQDEVVEQQGADDVDRQPPPV